MGIQAPQYPKSTNGDRPASPAPPSAPPQSFSYGCCPQCGADGAMRERRLNGNDTCANGHVYPSRDAVQKASQYRPVEVPSSDYWRRMITPTPQPTPVSCFRACVASIFGIRVEDVPACCDGPTWNWDAFQEWLAKNYRLQCLEVSLSRGAVIYPMPKTTLCIITGDSPRECSTGRHAVIAITLGLDGFEIIHDPHESNAGLAGEPTHACYFCLVHPNWRAT